RAPDTLGGGARSGPPRRPFRFSIRSATMAQMSVLKAEVRDRAGKGAARAVRREDKVPAVIYGDKKPPMLISLPQRETTRKLHSGGFLTHLVEIEVGGEKIRAIPKDYQLDPV